MKNFYLLFLSISFICGILLASLGTFAFIHANFLIILITILFILLALSIKRNFLFIAILLFLVFLLGVIRYNVFNTIDPDHIKNYTSYTQKEIMVKGEIVSDPEDKKGTGNKKTFVLNTNVIKLHDSWRNTNGLVLVNLYKKSESPYQYGDILILEGSLKRPFSYKKRIGFDYEEYLANKRIFSILYVKKGFFIEKVGENRGIKARATRFIYSLRARLESHIETFLDIPYSSVLEGILLGKRQKIPPGLRSLFAKTGTLHILAISGLHVGIIYFALRIILKIFRIQKNPSIILCILFLICYTILTGARPSILRATTMFSIMAFGEIMKRKISIFNLIGLSSLIILAANPNQVFEIGFILSYIAVLSIVSISPFFYEIFRVKNTLGSADNLWKRTGYYILKSISVSLGAWLGLAPLIAYYFGLISPIIVIANLVVIPLLFMIMGSGILFISLGFLLKILATVLSQSTWFFLFILIKCINFLGNVPLGYFEIREPRLSSIILYYIGILAAINIRKVKLTFSFLT